MPNIKMTGIKEIESLVYTTEGCISLSQGMMKAYGIPKAIKNHIQEMLETDRADYYDHLHFGYHLKMKISEHIEKRYHLRIPAEQVILTHGCIGGISIALLTILEAYQEVIIPEPVYPLYHNIVELAKGVPIHVSCLSADGIDWDLNIERIKNATTSRTKAILFSNPWNPLGCCIPVQSLIQLIKWCEEKDIYLIVDEVYEDYVFDQEFQSALQFILNSHHVIRVTSFSKNFGIGGWRIGYIIVPQQLIQSYQIAQHSLLVMPSQIGQLAAEYVLDHPEISQFFHRLIYQNLLMCEDLLQPLVEKGYLSYIRPQGSFFLFLKTNEENTSERCIKMIQEAKVALIPGDRFGSSGQSFLRLCFGRDPETLQEGLKRFVDYWLETEEYKLSA